MLEGVQSLLRYTQVYVKQFAQKEMERFGLQEKRESTARDRESDKAEQRVAKIGQRTPRYESPRLP